MQQLQMVIRRSCRFEIVLLLLVSAGLAMPRAAWSAGVELDIPYVPDGGHMQQLDLYTPDTTDYPTIVFVHEGGLISGDRKDEPYAQIGRTFQQLGIGFAAINYRLAPDNKWPAQPNDVAAAFAWIKHNIATRRGDPDRVFLFGHSSGCLLVSIVGADSQYLMLQGLSQSDVAGVISLGCRLDDYLEIRDTSPARHEASWVPTDKVAEYLASEPAFVSVERRNDAVPSSHVTADLPPFLVLVAKEERFYPPILADGAEFVGRALDAGADADLEILRDRKHMSAMTMMVNTDDPTMVTVTEFVRAH